MRSRRCRSFSASLVLAVACMASSGPALAAPGGFRFLHTRQGATGGHPDVILNYLTWDGSHWTARLTGGRFFHTRRGASSGHAAPILNYKTWDGSNWTARLVGGRFLHTRQGARSGHYAPIMNYKSWGGDSWTARLIPVAAAPAVARVPGLASAPVAAPRAAAPRSLSIPTGPPLADMKPVQRLLPLFGLPPGSDPLLLAAIRRKEGRTAVAPAVARIARDRKERLGVARHLLVVAIATLSKHPSAHSAAERAFYRSFQRYFEAQRTAQVRQVANAWTEYKAVFQQGQRPQGQPAVSALLRTPEPSLKGFKMPEVSWNLSGPAQEAVAQVIGPLVAQVPEVAHLVTSAQDHTLDIALNSIGLAGSTVGVVLAQLFLPKAIGILQAAIGGIKLTASALSTGISTALVQAPTALGFVGSAVAGVAASLAIGVAVALPVLLAGVMHIVDIARTRQFEERLDQALKSDPNVDLHGMFLSNFEETLGGCYAACPTGFSAVGNRCLQRCAPGYQDDGLTCRKAGAVVPKARYARGAGRSLGSCPAGSERNGALCYPSCRPGFRGNGPLCQQQCPAGFADIGVSCRKPPSHGRGAGYGWKFGDPPNLDAARRRCQQANPQGCEQSGALVYPRCRPGYRAVGCCTCSPVCPAGMRDDGAHCGKQSYPRGAGSPMRCAAHEEQSGALCYPRCRAGYRGTGSVCWGGCPAGYQDNGATCAKNVGIVAKQSRERRSISTKACPTVGQRKRNRVTLLAYLAKMLVADPSGR